MVAGVPDTTHSQVDHTAYTLTTAGSEGFLNLLPVLLDHILFPLITEAGNVPCAACPSPLELISFA